MFQVFHLDVAMTIQVCFNSILHMLRWSDGCCRGDETLGREKGRVRDKAQRRIGARRGEECGGLDVGGTTGMGIESWMVGHGHWRKIGHGQPDVTRWRGI